MSTILFGAAHVDRIGFAESDASGTSAPGRISQGPGGVGFNVARSLKALKFDPLLVSVLGDDAEAHIVKSAFAEQELDSSGLLCEPGYKTATYHALINWDGSLLGGVADMEIYRTLTIPRLAPFKSRIEAANLIFVDANLPEETLVWIADCDRNGLLVANSVSEAKAGRVVPIMKHLDVLFTNVAEGSSMGRLPAASSVREIASALCATGARAVVVSDGGGDLGFCEEEQQAYLYPVLPCNPIDETGAGDALIAGTLLGLLKGHALDIAVRTGLSAARVCMETEGAALPASRLSEIATDLKGHP